ncbi:Putative monooxygenase [Fundidesulfovibrio magnetotacticus]|uniref:Monooxygenase n=1 Tax=Fundidesulfovibrio magnetotacticus TaxID=2730080 RepID=A0A6V8LV96_9BACT|nr:putative quinol monooxygenase [Fundidesulfovibrio magnetotacticus]GFK94029.1 Putative monooxygenase [Fundidesulfovibrio magnetotacticus]
MIFMTAAFTPAQDKEHELEALLRGLVGETAREPGALEYMLHRTRQQPPRFVFYERFADQAALDSHMAEPFFQKAKARFADLLAGPPEVAFFDLVAGFARPFEG